MGFNSNCHLQVVDITDPNLSLEEQCPGVRESELLDTRPCEDNPCPVYHWEIGPWTSCITQGNTGTVIIVIIIADFITRPSHIYRMWF